MACQYCFNIIKLKMVLINFYGFSGGGEGLMPVITVGRDGDSAGAHLYRYRSHIIPYTYLYLSII